MSVDVVDGGLYPRALVCHWSCWLITRSKGHGGEWGVRFGCDGFLASVVVSLYSFTMGVAHARIEVKLDNSQITLRSPSRSKSM